MNTAYAGEPYIEVWNGRVVIGLQVRTESEYTVKRATNWRDLEPEARDLLRSMETPAGATVFPCPPDLARRASFTDDADSDWISLARASRASGLSHDELNDAVKRGFLEVRILFAPSKRKQMGSRRMVRRSQMHTVWSFPLRVKLRWLADCFGVAEESYLNARFWKKVRIDTPGACWEWQAGKSHGGYGLFWEAGKSRPAHRIVYAMMHGGIEKRKPVHHSCGNKLCVNPMHLTMKD